MAGRMVEFQSNGQATQGYLATPAAGNQAAATSEEGEG